MSERSNYTTRTVIEHRYTIPAHPAWEESNEALKWAREIQEMLGLDYSITGVAFENGENDTTILVIREVQE